MSDVRKQQLSKFFPNYDSGNRTKIFLFRHSLFAAISISTMNCMHYSNSIRKCQRHTHWEKLNAHAVWSQRIAGMWSGPASYEWIVNFFTSCRPRSWLSACVLIVKRQERRRRFCNVEFKSFRAESTEPSELAEISRSLVSSYRAYDCAILAGRSAFPIAQYIIMFTIAMYWRG